MRHGGTDLIGDEGGLHQRAPLVASSAKTALLAGEGEEVFVPTVGTLQPGEAGVQVAAAQERGHGLRNMRRQWGHVCR